MSNPYDNTRNQSASVLGPTLKFKGELSADEDLLIQGTVEGSIKHTSSLTIGENGHVKADTTAEYIVVEGSVDGDLHGAKSVKVRESATINGNIWSPSVSLVEGATFNGNVDMSGEAPATRQQNAETQAPAKAVAEAPEESTDKAAKVEAEQPARKKSTKAPKKSADAA